MGSLLSDGFLLLSSPTLSPSSSLSARQARISPLTNATWHSSIGRRRYQLSSRPLPLVSLNGAFQIDNQSPLNSDAYNVGDFMTKKENLKTVKPSSTIDEALEILVEHRITGLPVVDDDWVLVGVVSDYDLLALDSISGHRETGTDLFPEADRSWKLFNEVQRLLSKTVGRVIGDVMTTAPIVVRETTNLEDAARLLLETGYRRLPVVDHTGKLVGIITRGNVVGAALKIKQDMDQR